MDEMQGRKRSAMNIGNKIFAAFIVLVLLFAVNASIILYTANNVKEIVSNSSQVVNPSRDAINDLITLVHRSKMLITNWVYLQGNEDDKALLRGIIEKEYPELKERITALMTKWDEGTNVSSDSTSQALMSSALVKFDALLNGSAENIVTKLTKFEDYEDPTTKMLSADYIDQYVVPESAGLIQVLEHLRERQNEITTTSEAHLVSSTKSLLVLTLILSASLIVIALLFAYLLKRSITIPIHYVRDMIFKMSRGELVEDHHRKFSNDEIGQMVSAMDDLVKGLKATTHFAENIGNGKYDSEFKALSDKDVLGAALLTMRSNLVQVAIDDKRRAWTTEGLAKFADILRSRTNNLDELSDKIIASLVKYLDANQGALFLVNDTDPNDTFIEMVACYAYDRKKFLNKRIEIGEGITGQCIQERDTIYLSDVPGNYLKITSGLGEALPRHVLVVPLRLDEQIFGAVELASFQPIEPYHVEFVEKVGQSIASTISSAKTAAHTKHLLEQAQQMTEEMRAQEEEMRQNMEELQATQEQLIRNQRISETSQNGIEIKHNH
jgi:predicted transcriptional regulator